MFEINKAYFNFNVTEILLLGSVLYFCSEIWKAMDEMKNKEPQPFLLWPYEIHSLHIQKSA